MTDASLSRHARHLALPQVGAEGQERISNSTALLVGVGGIGCSTASYLAASGVGHLVLCDFDTVDATLYRLGKSNGSPSRGPSFTIPLC